MNIDKFMEKFAEKHKREQKKWCIISFADSPYMLLIRCETHQCPMAYLANTLGGYEGATEIGLSMKDAIKIANAADYSDNTQTDEESIKIRNQFIDILNPYSH